MAKPGIKEAWFEVKEVTFTLHKGYPIYFIVNDGMVHSMDDIALVEVAPLQVLGMKKTGTYHLIPELNISETLCVDRNTGISDLRSDP